MESGIRRFLEDVDPKILGREENYYRSGQVESVDWDGSHVTAEVSGSEEEPYLVELEFSADGEVEAWSCDCPYDWGPVCKHMVAALLAIQAEPPKEALKKKIDNKIDIRSLVEKAEKEQLAALETVELAANGLVQSGEPRGKFVRKVLETAEGPAFDSWDHWRYDLLRRAAVLADMENEKQFCILLDHPNDRFWETFQKAPRYGYEKEDKITRYYIMSSAHGTEDARAYLEQNLKVDELRLILIREDMAKGAYAHAERLCRDRLEKEQAERRHWPSQWQYLLYEIYRDWGQREEQTSQARRLALLGDRDFYQTAKDLLTEDGRWQEEYPGFLAELTASRPAYEYMEILKQEDETALLMEQVRHQPETVFQYGDMLVQQ